MEREKKLRVGILGLGAISQSAHLESARRCSNVELVAICDVAQDLLAQMSVVHHVRKTYTDYDEMLRDDEIDAIVLGIAHEFHVPCAIKALRAGKHVLVEKPLGLNLQECLELKKVVEETGLVLQVGNMKRFDGSIRFAKDFIQNSMGEMLTFNAWYCDNAYRYTTCDNVMPIIEKSIGSIPSAFKKQKDPFAYNLVTHGSHLVDTARYIGGEIESMQASYREKYGAVTFQVNTHYKNGAVGNLDLTVAVKMDWHEGFFVYGENGSVVAKTYNPWYFMASDVEVFDARDMQYHRPHCPDGHFYKLQMEGFADTILNNAPMNGANIDDGVAAIRALCAISESVKENRRVKLSEVKGVI